MVEVLKVCESRNGSQGKEVVHEEPERSGRQVFLVGVRHRVGVEQGLEMRFSEVGTLRQVGRNELWQVVINFVLVVSADGSQVRNIRGYSQLSVHR